MSAAGRTICPPSSRKPASPPTTGQVSCLIPALAHEPPYPCTHVAVMGGCPELVTLRRDETYTLPLMRVNAGGWGVSPPVNYLSKKRNTDRDDCLFPLRAIFSKFYDAAVSPCFVRASSGFYPAVISLISFVRLLFNALKRDSIRRFRSP